MKAYKGFKKHEDGTLWCRDFQYEVGKTYTFDGYPILCQQGFHACHEPYQCWLFYPNNGENVYYEVECGGRIVEERGTGDGKFVCTEIKLIREIPAPEYTFDWCDCFGERYAIVARNGKYNYINTNGRLLSEQWFDWYGCFGERYVIVRLNGKFNYINSTDGKPLSKRWFDSCGDFQDGYAIVELNNKYNLINTEGKYLSKQWFDYCRDFHNGFAEVELDGEYNYIDTEGKYLSEQWFDSCYDFKDGYAKVLLDGKWYKIDTNGKITEI